MNINTTEGMIEAHTQGAAEALVANLETMLKREAAQYRFDTVGLPRFATVADIPLPL